MCSSLAFNTRLTTKTTFLNTEGLNTEGHNTEGLNAEGLNTEGLNTEGLYTEGGLISRTSLYHIISGKNLAIPASIISRYGVIFLV